MRSHPAARDRARFGALRTLNLRAALPTGDESAARVEGWLRSKQVEMTGEVLIITGRGAGSIGGVPVVKERTVRVLNRLRRVGVIQAFGEDTPGSFVVTLAPLRSLLEAPARRSTPAPAHPKRSVAGLHGLSEKTREQLRYLAERALDGLGVREVSPEQVNEEMLRQFSILVRSAPPSGDANAWLDFAITRALSEYGDSDR
jgi:hypothetical protein